METEGEEERGEDGEEKRERRVGKGRGHGEETEKALKLVESNTNSSCHQTP